MLLIQLEYPTIITAVSKIMIAVSLLVQLLMEVSAMLHKYVHNWSTNGNVQSASTIQQSGNIPSMSTIINNNTTSD